MAPTAGGNAVRIGLVHPYSWPGVRRGGERYLSDLAWFLGVTGHDVEVVTGTTGEPSVERVGRVTVRRVRHLHPGPLARRGVSPLDTFGAVALVPLRRERYDVVHALTPTAAVAARLAGHRTVYTVIGHPTPGQFRRRPFDRRLVEVGVRAADAVTALSRASAAQVESMFGREARVLPPGVRLDAFPTRTSPPTGTRTVLFNADASDPRKGVHLAMAATARLDGVRLVVAGPGDHTWALHGLGGRASHVDVRGPGELADVPARYRHAWVTVLPSLHEAFGLVLVESLASGTPVVGAAAGGIPEVVDDLSVGRLAPHGDVDALAAAVADTLDLAADPATAARCAAHARRWGWLEAVGPAHVALYESLVEGAVA